VSTIVQRVLKGVGSQALQQAWTIAFRFLELPLFLSFWPVSKYGEWLVLSSVVTYLTLSDLGVSQVINRGIIMAASAGKRREASELLETGIIFSSTISACAAFVFVSAIFVYEPISNYLSGLGARLDIVNISIMMAAGAILSLQKEYWLGVLASVGRYPIGLLINTIIQVGVFATTAAALACGASAVFVSLCVLICQCTGQAFICILAFRSASWIKPKVPSFSLSHLIQLWRPTAGIFGVGLQQTVYNDVLRLIVGFVAGPALVVSYTAHIRLARFLSVTTRLSYPLNVEMGLAFGAGLPQRFRQLARANVALCGTAAFGCAIVEMIFSPLIFDAWVRNSTSFDPVMFAVLLIGSFEDVLGQLALAPLLATNRYSTPALFTTVVVIALIPISYLLGYRYGILGVAFAQMAAQSIVLIILASYYNEFVGEGLFTSASRAFGSAARKNLASTISNHWRRWRSGLSETRTYFEDGHFEA
jgi:O-antigen/teichoic acid export membrane protein